MTRQYAFALAAVAACTWASVCHADAPNGKSPLTVAALPFVEASSDQMLSPLGAVVGDILMIRLSGAEGLVFVERAAIDKVLEELELSATADAADRARLGRALGARFVMTGSLTATGDTIHVTAHLLEVSTTRVAGSAKVTVRGGELVESVDTLARELAGLFRLELPELTQEQIDRSPEANLHFMRGLGYYHAGMPEHATTQFMKTLAIDPGHAEARFYNGLNYFDRAEQYSHARIEFARFLKEFGSHPLARRAKQKLQQCEIRLGNPTDGGRS